MTTFAFVPEIPGSIREVFIGVELFEMHPDVSVHWHEAPDGALAGDLFDGAAWARPDLTPTRAQRWTAQCATAMAALSKSSETIDRITEAVSLGSSSWGAADVVAFMHYRRDLRAYPKLDVSDTSQPLPTLPTHPGYPVGT